MSELKKLFQVKRILAMVLAAAMTITSLPATAHAAESGDLPTVTEAETEDTSVQGNTDEIDTEGGETAEAAGTVTTVQTGNQPETDDTTRLPESDGQQSSEDSAQPAADDATPADNERETAPSLGTSAFIGTDRSDMYSATGASPIADADGKKLDVNYLANFSLTVNDGTEQERSVFLSDLTDPVAATVTYQWFAGDSALGDAKKLAEEGTLPTDAGDYTFKLVLPAKEGTYAGAEAAFSYTITRPEVTVSVGEPETVPVGTKWSDVPVPEIYSVSADNGKDFQYATDLPDTEANEAADNEVTFTVVIKDAATGAALTGDETLMGNGEYVLSLVPEFIGANKDKYAKNYTWASCGEQKITIGSLKATRLTLTPDAAYKAKAAAVANDDNERTVQIIDADSVTKELQELKYSFVLETEDGLDEQNKTKWKAIEGETSGAWYTAASYTEPWTEKNTVYCNLTLGGRLDTVPATAGAYVYRVSYAGNQAEYDACYADILVVVDVAEIIVKPAVSDKIVFYDGESVKDVLEQITYTLPYADGRTDDKGQPALYPQTEYMWGTSYVSPGETQPYKPAFELVEIVKDKDGKETGRNTYTSYDDAVLTFGNEYIVRFSGQKNVYTAAGTVSGSKDINAAVDSMDPSTCGFKVKTDSNILEANTVEIKVTEKDKAIDVTQIEKAASDKAKMTQETVGVLEGAYTKTYDGKKIFDLYADYKKAKLEKGDSDPVKDFSYQWQKSSYTCGNLLGTHKETVDGQEKDVPDVSKEALDNSWSSTFGISPVNAGVYRLRITYRSSRVQGYAEPAYVYFVIRQQEITLGFDETVKLVGNVGNSVSAFTKNYANKLGEGMTLTPAMDQPAKAEDWKNAALLTASADYAYQVTWGFYQKAKTTNAEGQEVDQLGEDGKPVYNTAYSLQSTGEYFLGVSNIRLGKYSPWSGVNTVHNQNYDVKKELYIPVTVKEMGTDAILFDGITTTGGQEIEKTKTYDGESIYDLIKTDLEKLNAPIIVKTDETSGAETKEPVTFTAEDNYRLIYTVQYDNGEARTYETLPTEAEEWAWAKNGGTYTISAEFAGNERYDRLYITELAMITVTPMQLILTLPELTEEFEAGQPVTEVLYAAECAFKQQETAGVRAAEGTIPAEDMEKYFTRTERNGEKGFLAWSYKDYDTEYVYFEAPSMAVHDSIDDYDYTWGDENLLQGASDQRYSLRLDGNYFYNEDCSYNYEITEAEPAAGTPIRVVRGASTVAMDEYASNDNKNTTKIDIADNISTPKEVVGSIVKEHTVTIKDGIAYYNGGSAAGNLVRVTIQAPNEYSDAYLDWDKAGYEQSIRNAAGDRLIGSIQADTYDNQIRFTYDATALEAKDKKDLEFCIRWEEDYSEKFILKFSEATLLGNLQEAVAPKSLAFNAAPKTMLVGQTQALDVKITKEQNADIICLGYKITDGGKNMHIDEFGKVTALQEGKATVEVYPMHLVNGKKEPIDGAKSAKTTITVKKVSAPKITKVTAGDTDVSVEYTLPNSNDGYRREIYVVEGKNVKADLIEKKVSDEMKNEQWQGIFAVAPRFVSYDNEWNSRVYDIKKGAYTNTVRFTISGLEPQKDYTVYVRNVSAVRSFADGCQVSLSAAGSAKAGKTSARYVEDIVATLQDEEIKQIDGADVDEPPTQDEIRDGEVIYYEVPLTKKNVQISLEGLFRDEAGDETYAALPLAGQDLKDLKNKYAVPKLTYYFLEYMYEGYDALGYWRNEDYGWLKTSSIATVSNKGKLTLKQPGEITVAAVDSVSGEMSNFIVIQVTAEADSIAAKNTTMEVGQRIRLENLAVYKQGKTVLDQSKYSTYNRIDVKAAQAALKSAGKEDSFGISAAGYLTAYAKDSVNLTLTDTVLNKQITVKVTAKDLSPVKNLKAVNVIDNRFDVQFEMNPYAEAYRIEVMDAKKVIRSIYVENIPFSEAPRGLDNNGNWVHDPDYTDDDWGTGIWGSGYTHYDEHWYRTNNELCRADKTNGKWVLTYRIKKLTQSSKYNISVTALYGEAAAKTVKKAVTTTKLPAYDYALSGKIEAGVSYNRGMSITTRNGSSIGSYSFVSGNTYSLQASGANQAARIAGTDTLTWTSSDKKVATVQATNGGYGATLKAVKDGTTTIEVKSKILKAPVARITIAVYTVGDAYKGRDYYGDNEDLRGDGITKPNVVTELTVGVAEPVELSVGQSRRFQVTLLEEGAYQAYQVQNGNATRWTNITVSSSSYVPYTWDIGTINGSFTGSVIVKKTGIANAADIKNRTVIRLDETIPQLQTNAWYVFTAPKDGMYGIKSYDSFSTYIFDMYKQSPEQDAELNTTVAEPQRYFYELKQGEVVYLKVRSSYSDVKIVEAEFETLTTGSSATVPGRSEKWFVFTPEEMDQYEIKAGPYSSFNIGLYDTEFASVNWESSGNTWDDDGILYATYSCTLDDKVYVRASSYSNDAFNLSIRKKGSFQKFGTDGTYTINREFTGHNDYLYITYTVPEDGFYTFSSGIATGDLHTKGYADLVVNGNEMESWNIISTAAVATEEEYWLTTSDQVLIRVRPNQYPEMWKDVVIKAEKTGDVPAAITQNDGVVSATVPKQKAVWYSFKAPEEAEYVAVFLPMTDDTGYIDASWYTEVTDSFYLGNMSVNLANGAFMNAITIGAGETRYLKVNNTNSDAKSFQVKIQKVEDQTVTTEKPVDLTLQENWVSFTADADAYYAFQIKKTAANTNLNILVYADREGREQIASYQGSGGMTLEQDQTIWLKATANYPAAAEETVDQLMAAKAGEINQVTGTGEVNGLKIANAFDSFYAVVKFTADAEGSYTFKGADANISSMAIYEDSALSKYIGTVDTPVEEEDGSKTWRTDPRTMSAGDTVYLRINLSAASTDLSLTVSTDAGEEVTP